MFSEEHLKRMEVPPWAVAGAKMALPSATDEGVGYGATAQLERVSINDIAELTVDALPPFADSLDSAALAQHGLEAAPFLDSPRKLYITREGAPLRPTPASVEGLCAARGGWLIDFEGLSEPFSFALGDSWLIFAPPDEGGSVMQFYDAPGQLSGALTIESPLSDWLIDLNDSWLEGELTRRLDSGDSFDHACALGMVLRLRNFERSKTRDLVARVLAGEAVEDFARERRWIRQQSAETLKALERHGLVASSLLSQEIQELYEEGLNSAVACDSKSWQQNYLELCQRRDEFEGLAGLLEETGHGGRLGAALLELDERAEVLFGALPVGPLEDEHLSRAARVSFDKWWTACCRIESDAGGLE
jgi:hypothetical protein